MGRRNTKGTQKVNPVIDASIESPPYETALGMSNTEEVKSGKDDNQIGLNSCYCKNDGNIHPTRTWESITNMYGDADTTEVWDSRHYRPKVRFSPKLPKKENHKAIIDKSDNNSIAMYPTSNLKSTPAKLSFIGLYRKHKNNRNEIGPHANANSLDMHVKSSRYPEPKVKFLLSKKPKKIKPNYATKEIFTETPGRKILKDVNYFHDYKQDKITSKRTNFNNNDNIDQISPMPLKNQNLQNIQCKCSFIGKIIGNKICKCKNNNKNTFQTLSTNDNNNKEKNKTKTSTKENNIIKKSKNKQANAKQMKDEEVNVGYGDQISQIPLKKQNLQDLQCKCSFIGKIMGHTICKCKNINGSLLKASNNVNNDNNKTEKNKTRIPTKENKIMKKSKHKQIKAKKMEKQDGNVGYGDQISSIPFKKRNLQNLQSKCSFFGKMTGPTICKCKNNKGSTFQTSRNVNDPTVDSLLEMKVNLKDMRVINSSEVDKKIRKLGRTEKNMSCICPSKRLDHDRVCERGPCEKALENQHNFDCKCRKQTQDIIECKDSTCDLKFPDIRVKSRKKKNLDSPVYTKDKKPLLEVMLDPTKMKIINSNELKDIIRERERNVHLNCKCIGKKLSPLINECEERSCRNPEKKYKISYLCSRVFSKSEYWSGQKEYRMRRPIRGNGYGINTKRNGVMINLPRGRTPKKGTYVGGTLWDVWCKCFCECDTKKPKKTQVKKKTIKKIKKRRSRRRKRFFRKKKKDHRTLKEKILDCLDREQEECEKKVKKKSKEYKKNEKKTIKENKKIEAEQKDEYSIRQYELNCLTNFIIGFLNVGLQSIRTIFKIPFSVLRDPISSYIYVKEKIKNPPAAVIRIIQWFIRTWRNKTSVMAKTLEESAALNVIADQIESSAVYNTLASQGRTPDEKMVYERRLRKRKRRMQKRQDEAVYGCRHVLLMTMRKTPCIWFYHICPELYPQCLGLTQFMHNFLHIILFCGAIICWTPCIIVCEMCRAFLCCFFCTN